MVHNPRQCSHHSNNPHREDQKPTQQDQSQSWTTNTILDLGLTITLIIWVGPTELYYMQFCKDIALHCMLWTDISKIKEWFHTQNYIKDYTLDTQRVVNYIYLQTAIIIGIILKGVNKCAQLSLSITQFPLTSQLLIRKANKIIDI